MRSRDTLLGRNVVGWAGSAGLPLPAILLLAFLLIAVATPGPAAGAARIETENIVLRADAGFVPNLLPIRAFAPIEIRGRASVNYRGPGVGRELTRLKVDFSRNGRVNSVGLPVCRAARLTGTDTAQARARCRGALVATGVVGAAVEPPGGGRFQVSSPLSVFNGPPVDGRPSVLIHAHARVPQPETYLVAVRLERPRSNRFGGIHLDIEVPEIAAGRGYLNGASIRVKRRYRHRGRVLSYVAARCPDNYLAAHGRFEFADQTVIDGTLLKYCAQRRR